MPPHVADYRAGRLLAEGGKPLPAGSSAATRVGWHIRHNPAENVFQLETALRELPEHQRRTLGAACQATVAAHYPMPADSDGQLARVALMAALVAITYR